MNFCKKLIAQAAIFGFMLFILFNQKLSAQENNTKGISNVSFETGLSKHDFFYSGISNFQNMYIIKNGKAVWEYEGPKNMGSNSDATLMKNGNILYAHQLGVTLMSPKHEVLWNYDSPADCEIHTAQPIGKKHVVFIQNGNPAQVFIINMKNGKTVKNFVLPVKYPENAHGQFRHARLTVNCTLLVAHMDLGKVCEYDSDGKELFSMDAPGIWDVEPSANNNILICGSKLGVKEINRKKEVLWEITPEELLEMGLKLPLVASRLSNGNTIITNWIYGYTGKVDLTNPPIQLIELTPAKKVVWTLKSWEEPNLGPGTIIQLLNEKGISGKRSFGKLKH